MKHSNSQHLTVLQSRDSSTESRISVCLLLTYALLFFFTPYVNSANASSNTTQQSLTSRNVLFSHLTIQDGLSQRSITSITQDTAGYMWFGTQEGLNRYDGQNIKVFVSDDEDNNTLSSDWIWDLFTDNDGTLWVATDGGGLNRYNREENNFSHFRHNSEDTTSISSDRIRVIYQDSHEALWIGTDGGGLNKFDPASGQFIRFRNDKNDPNSLQNDSVLSIYEDRIGTLWIGTNGGGLASLDRANNKFVHYQHNPEISSSISGNQVRAIYEDRDGNLWVGTYKSGLNLFNPSTGTFSRFRNDPTDPSSLSNDKVRHIQEDRYGNLWIATDGGLSEWSSQSNTFLNFLNNPADTHTLSSNSVNRIFQDRGGVLWVGTQNGLNKWNYLSDSFNYYQTVGTAITISNEIVTSIAEYANGNILIGTYGGGLNIIDYETGTTTVHRYNPDDKNSLSQNRVMTISVDQEQNAWLGTRTKGLSRFDVNTGQFTHYQHHPDISSSLSSNSITSILNEANNQIWVGTYGGGLNLGDTKTGKFIVFRHIPEDNSSISSDRILAIFRDRNSNLWIGTEDGGLNRYNDQTQSFTRFNHDPKNHDSLSSNSAWSVIESSDGNLWVATNGDGLNKWSAEDRASGVLRFSHYGINEGLLSNSVQSIVEDKTGSLWITSNRGLTRLNPQSGETRHFSYQNGLKSNDFTFGARLRTQSGRLLFGGSTGVVSFYPDQIKTNRHKPDLILSSSTRKGLINKVYSTRPQNNTISLNYTEDLISFDFIALDYTSPENNMYRYKLNGFDNNWSKASRIKRATYTNLPSGSYTFQVQASNNVGLWNEKGLSFSLDVIPPPWKTGWAYAAYIILTMTIIVFFIQLQNRKLKRETRQRTELESQVKARTQELSHRNSELEELNVKLKESNWTDSLTGLKNRRYLREFIESEVALANRQAKETGVAGNLASSLDESPSLSFMMIDLDGFKTINDTYGHYNGDQALLHVKDILLNCCRKSDIIIRWGGDEFLIISRNTSTRAVEKLAERIRFTLDNNACKLSQGQQVRLTGSIGFAGYPFSPLDPKLFTWEQVSDIADRAAYISKANGRNAWVGINCTRNSNQINFSKIRKNLNALMENGFIDIKTSIKGKLKLAKQKKVYPMKELKPK